jgi:hypothetical protein
LSSGYFYYHTKLMKNFVPLFFLFTVFTKTRFTGSTGAWIAHMITVTLLSHSLLAHAPACHMRKTLFPGTYWVHAGCGCVRAVPACGVRRCGVGARRESR